MPGATPVRTSSEAVAAAKVHPKTADRPWVNLIVAWLGWLFDGMEMGIYSLIAVPALKDLMQTSDMKTVLSQVGLLFSLFLLGAALGGYSFGRLGDKIGRVKSLALTVICYSLFTGLSAACTEVWQFGVCRFLGALGLGGEWGLGVALVMESWSNKSRPMLAGVLGAAANIGFLACALVGILMARFVPGGVNEHWRLILLIGTLPAITVLFMLFGVREPEAWKRSKARGEKPDVRILLQPGLLYKTVMGCLIASVVVLGTWGVFQWIPSWVDQLVGTRQTPYQKPVTQMFMALGQIAGAFSGGFIAEWMGRRKSYALFCIGSFISSAVLFYHVHSYGPALWWLVAVTGVFSTAFFGWLPLYLPELFPTRIRATGEGITYNFGRILAAIGVFAGMANFYQWFGEGARAFAKASTAMASVYLIGFALIWFVPETKGQTLPE
jgi:MFS transporter, SHS family, sialic acid transporter